MAAGKASSMMLALIMVAGILESASAVTHTLTWTFATSATESDDWASNQNFVVGDEIAFVYTAPNHDVFEVSEADLKSCNLDKPINEYLDSNAVVTLDRSGYFGFVCGLPGHCSSPGNMKMNVQVAAASTPSPPPTPCTTPSPSPTPSTTPSPPPTPCTTPRPILAPLPSPPKAPTLPPPAPGAA